MRYDASSRKSSLRLKGCMAMLALLLTCFSALAGVHAAIPNVDNPTPEQILRWNLFDQYVRSGLESQLAILQAPGNTCELAGGSAELLAACDPLSPQYGQTICQAMKTIVDYASTAATNLKAYAAPGMTRTEILLLLGTGQSALTTLLGDHSSREVIWNSIGSQWSSALSAAAVDLPADSASLATYQDALTKSTQQYLICERLDCLSNPVWENSYKDFFPSRREEAAKLYTVLESVLKNYYGYGEDLPALLTAFGSPPFAECQDAPEILADPFSHFVCIGKNHSKINTQGYSVQLDMLTEAARAYRADVAQKARLLTGSAHFTPSRPELANMEGVNPNAPRFAWSRSACSDCGEVTYRIEIKQNDSTVFTQKGIEATSLKLPQNLDPGVKYSWAVFPISAYGLENSDVFFHTFKTGTESAAGTEPVPSLVISQRNGIDANWAVCKDSATSSSNASDACVGTAISSFRVHAGGSTCAKTGCKNRYSVDWGDGVGYSAFAETDNLEHIYSKPGLYTISLMVRDDHDVQSASIHWPVLVLDSPASGGALPWVRMLGGPSLQGAFTYQGYQIGGEIAGYYCSVDDRSLVEGDTPAPAAFTSNTTFTPTGFLKEGSHTFFVRAKSASTEAGLSPVESFAFIVEYDSRSKGRTPEIVATPFGQAATFNVELAFENRGTLGYEANASKLGYVEIHSVDVDGNAAESLIYPGSGLWLDNGKIRVTAKDGVDSQTGQTLFQFAGKVGSGVQPGTYPACFRLYKPYGTPGETLEGLYFGDIACLSIQVLPPSPDAQSAPLSPGSLTASLDGNGMVGLKWLDQSDNEDGFKISRRLEGTSSWTLIATVPSSECQAGGWQCHTDQVNLKGRRTYAYRVQAYNKAGDSNPVEVEIAVPNHAPVLFSSGALPPAFVGEDYFFQLKAADQDGDTLIFSSTQLPSGMALSSNGILSWIPLNADVGSHDLTVSVSDGSKKVQGALTLSVSKLNRSPRITSSVPVESHPPDLKPNEEMMFRVTAEDPNPGNVLTIHWVVDGVQKAVGNSYSFQSADPSTHVVEARAVDEEGLSASRFWSVKVRNYRISVVDGPHGTVTPTGSVEAIPGQTYSFSVKSDLCYVVRDVQVDGVSKGAVSQWDLKAKGDHVVAVAFKPAPGYVEPYIVSSKSGQNGKVTPSGSFCVDRGKSKTFTIDPDPHYHIYRVLVDEKEIPDTTTYTFKGVEKNHKIWASFELDEFTIKAAAKEHGKIIPSGVFTLGYGWKQAFAIKPDEAYVVHNVLIDGKWVGPVSNHRFDPVAADHLITAYFKPDVPQADAGPDQTVFKNETVVLSGANTTDSGVGIKTYQWTSKSSQAVNWQKCEDPAPYQVCFKAPDKDSVSLLFELTVTDKKGFSSKDACIVNVVGAKAPPIARAGLDQTVHEKDVVTLDGSGSKDPDGAISSYSWTQLSGTPVKLAAPNAAKTTFKAPVIGIEGAALGFLLTVTDGQGLRSTDRCVVNITTGNKPPVAKVNAKAAVNEKDLVTLNGLASSDPDGTIVLRRWKQTRGTPVKFSSPKISKATFFAPLIRNTSETLTFDFTVTDNKGLQSTFTRDVTIKKVYDSLRVDLSPKEAVDAGARWRVDNGPWMNSGAVVENLSLLVPHTIRFKYVAGYTPPPDQKVVVKNGRIVPATGVYTARSGGLRVMIYPPDANSAGAAWRINGGEWKKSGETVNGLNLVDTYRIDYKELPGWVAPAPRNVKAQNGKIVTVYGGYTLKTGSVQVFIGPKEAVAAGALWHVDVRPWRKSGEVQDQVDILNSHTISYKGITGWGEPAPQVVKVEYGKTKVVYATYAKKKGSVDRSSENGSNAGLEVEPLTSGSAGPDQKVPGGAEVHLKGSNSLGADELISSWIWRQMEGASVSIKEPRSNQTTFEAPQVGPDGESLRFELSTRGMDGRVTTDECIVNVTDLNQPPVARAGLNQTVFPHEWFTLDGSRSFDSDNGIASYSWRQVRGPHVFLTDPWAVQTMAMAPDSGPEGLSLAFELTVTDVGGLKAEDTTIVNVLSVNTPPVARAGGNQTVRAGESVLLDGSGSTDPEGADLSFEWRQTYGPPVSISDPTGRTISFLAPKHTGKSRKLVFLLTVTDAQGLKHSDSVTVRVKRAGGD